MKYIESAGGRVVPVNYFATETELDSLFASLNGFLFPGGGSDLPPSAQYIFDKTKAAFDEGDYMPLWGTCLGFEWLMMAASANKEILVGNIDAENYSIPLDFTSAAESSRIFRSVSQETRHVMATENVTMNNHQQALPTSRFSETPLLYNFFNVLSTNLDRNGVEFVSTVEAIKYPIYGVQWHPEKNAFEFGETSDGVPDEVINHSPEAIAMTQQMANFFVNEARRNSHRFPTATEADDALIYNYVPTKTTTKSTSFVQQYYFRSY